jgi:hypothetical protein
LFTGRSPPSANRKENRQKSTLGKSRRHEDGLTGRISERGGELSEKRQNGLTVLPELFTGVSLVGTGSQHPTQRGKAATETATKDYDQD